MAFEVLDSITDATLDKLTDVYAEGDFVYTVSQTDDSLTIINASDPSNLSIEGYLKDSTNLNNALKIIKIGDYLYIAYNLSAYPYRIYISIIDISDKSSPSFVSNFYIGGFSIFSFMFLKNNFLFFGVANSSLLKVYDVSIPTSPSFFAEINNGSGSGINQILIDNNGIGYSVDTSSNLVTLFDLKDYFNGSYEGVIKDSIKLDDINDMVIIGEYLYVLRSGYLTVINISSLTITSYVNDTDLNGNTGGIAKYGNYIFTVSSGGKIVAFNVSNPASISKVSFTSASALKIEISGNYAYILRGYSSYTMSIYDISNPVTPVLKGYLSRASQYTTRFAVDGNYAYLPKNNSTNSGLYIYDVSDKSAPVLSGSVTGSTYFTGANDVVVSGNYAYVASASYFVIVDISSKTSPSVYNYLSIPYAAKRILYDGSYFYIISIVSIIKIDASDVDNPKIVNVFFTEIASINSSAGVSSGDIDGNGKLLIGGYNVSESVGKFNVSKFKSIMTTPLSSIDVTLLGNNPYSIILDQQGNLLVAIRDSNTVAIFDITDPTSPSYSGKIVDTTKLSLVEDVNSMNNQYAIAGSTDNSYLLIIDITDTSTPIIIGEIHDTTNLIDIVRTYRVSSVLYCASQSGDRITSVDVSDFISFGFIPRIMVI
jgi:hypothetical protein